MENGQISRILFVEDLPSDVELAQREIRKSGLKFTSQTVDTKADFLEALEEFQPDVIVSDYAMPGFNGLEARRLSLERDPGIPFILLTGSINEETAVECMKAGAADYVIKEHMGRLGPAVKAALQKRDLSVERIASQKRERKAAEALQFTDHAIKSIQECVSITDTEDNILFVNRAFENTYGYKNAELIGKPITILRSRKTPGVGGDILPATLKGSWKGEIMNRRKDGTEFAVDLSTSIVLDDEGRPRGLIGVATDITGRKRTEETLRESESSLSYAQELAKMGSWELDLGTQKIRCSDNYFVVLGYKINEIEPSTELFRSGIHPDDVHLFDGSYANLLKDKTPASLELRIIRPDGTVRWIQNEVVPVIESGKIARLKGVFFDITERKQAEAVLQKFQLGIERSADAVFMAEVDGTIMYVNAAFERIYGYTCQESIGKTPRILKSGLLSQEVYKQMWDTLLSKAVFTGELINKAKEGRLITVEVSHSPIVDKNGAIVGFLGIHRDITERKRVEQALQKSEDKYRKFFDEDLTGDYISTPDGKLLTCNAAFVEIFGFSSVGDALKHETSPLYKTPQDREIFLRLLRKQKELKNHEHEMCGVNGKPLHVIENAIGKFDEQGELVEIMGYLFDNTRRHEIEQQMIRAQKLESIGTLAGGIAHDLNNVLGPIMMGIEIVRANVQDAKSLRMLDTMASSTERGAEILKQVLTFARGAEGEKRLLQPKHLIGEVVRLIKETFPRFIEIRTDGGKDIPTIVADPTQVHQILLNLCVNARDAMPEDGKLTIGVESMDVDENFARSHLGAKPGQYVVFSVTDTGTGIPPEVKDRIFEPFYTTKEVGKGTGLGLSTVSSIAKNHRGFITVYSEVGKGTTFRVYFPAAQEERLEKKETPGKEIPRGGGELILIVDDEYSIREITKATLEHYGYRVVTANDGAEALDVYTKQQAEIKLVITDMMMPIMDGAQMIHALRKINPKVKVIAVSGLTLSGKTEVISEEEVVAFIRKPFSAETILRKIAEVLTIA